jgi:fused signal recognition particle receptor
MGLFDRLKQGLSKTRQGFVEKVEAIFKNRTVDTETLEELEETLILSDLGAITASEIVEHLKKKSANGSIQESDSVREFLKKEMVAVLGRSHPLVALGKTFCDTDRGVKRRRQTTTIGNWRADSGTRDTCPVRLPTPSGLPL